MNSVPSSIERLQDSVGRSWENILGARKLAQQKRHELREALVRLDSEDTSVVVFGSLARDEFTNSSDVDWTLLLDGSADPKHLELAGTVKDEVNRLALKPPGREGAFGNLVFSHDLIHKIGGQDDTN